MPTVPTLSEQAEHAAKNGGDSFLTSRPNVPGDRSPPAERITQSPKAESLPSRDRTPRAVAVAPKPRTPEFVPAEPLRKAEPNWLSSGSDVVDPSPDWLEAGSTVDKSEDTVLDNDPPVANPPAMFTPTTEESFLHETSIGRVLDAVGEGMSDGYGESALGLSAQSEKLLRDANIIGDTGNPLTQPLRTFNEAMIRPAAKVFDFAMRGLEASVKGVAKGAGGLARELGADPGMAKRLTRDVLALAETAGLIGAAVPLTGGMRTTVSKRVANEAVDIPVEQVARIERNAVDAVIPNEIPSVKSPVPDARAPLPADVTAVQTVPSPRTNNINLNRISAGEDVKAIITETAEANGGFQDARRGFLPLAETESMAAALGMTEKQLLKRNFGDAFNAEELLAARSLLVDSAADVRRLAKKVEGGSDEDILAFAEASTRHSAIQEQVVGLTAEAGRALSQFRILATESRDAKAIGEVIENLGGRGQLDKVAEAISKLDTPAQVSKFLMEARTATTSEKFLEAWINGLLSGPATHVANVTGNLLTAINTVPETAIAATIGKARTAFTGDKAAERVLFGEAAGRLSGILQGSRDGVIAGARAFLTEVPSAGSKLEQTRRAAIPSKKVEGKIGEAFQDLTGTDLEIGGIQLRIPTRLLQAEDELFKAIGKRQEINALAYRKADAEGLTGQAFRNRVTDLVRNPTDEMVEAAEKYAKSITFQTPLGEIGNNLMRFSNSHPLIKVTLPFVRTPINIVKYAGKRSPLGLLSKEVRDNLKGVHGAVARDQEYARQAMGGMVATAVVSLAAEGLITGSGPSDPKERAVLRASGWQPNSIKVGDTYYSYARFEPFALMIGIAADLQQFGSKMTDDETEELGTALVVAISKNLVSKTWLKGPADLIQALTDPDRYGEGYVSRMIGTLVPTGVAQVARAEDPVMRDARTALDGIKARIPGLSTSLLPKRDIYGQPIRLEGALGPDVASTIYTSRDRNDPVTQELIALNITPGRLSRTVANVELTPEEYDRFQLDAGTGLRASLESLVSVEGWSDLPEFVRTEAMEKAIAQSRLQARKLLMLDPVFSRRILEYRLQRLEALEN